MKGTVVVGVVDLSDELPRIDISTGTREDCPKSSEMEERGKQHDTAGTISG
jgi:hypothetical protein